MSGEELLFIYLFLEQGDELKVLKGTWCFMGQTFGHRSRWAASNYDIKKHTPWRPKMSKWIKIYYS